MAIADLLWACPLCGRDRGLRADEDDLCGGCGTRFDRVRGARIRARTPTGEETVRTAAEWVDRLPDPAGLLTGRDPVRSSAVRARAVERYETVRERGRYLNRIEIFGEEVPGTLRLDTEALSFTPDGGEPRRWDFGALRAVQASSRSLQVRGRPHPLTSFAFADDSSFLWEQLIALALAAFYRRTGRGEIVELQPEICVR